MTKPKNRAIYAHRFSYVSRKKIARFKMNSGPKNLFLKTKTPDTMDTMVRRKNLENKDDISLNAVVRKKNVPQDDWSLLSKLAIASISSQVCTLYTVHVHRYVHYILFMYTGMYTIYCSCTILYTITVQNYQLFIFEFLLSNILKKKNI